MEYKIFLNTRTWRKKSKEIKKRDNNECQWCKEKGKVSKADVTHHIKSGADYPALRLVNSNLVALCRECHEESHGRSKKEFFEINVEKW